MKRVVTNNDQNGESFIVSHSITNIEIPLPDFDKGFKFYNLWTTNCMPVIFNNNDPVKNSHISTSPPQDGSMFRIVNYPPERELINKFNSMTPQELKAFEIHTGVKLTLNGKHPLMHMTKSIDFAIVLQGEIYLVLDKEEVLLKPFDTVIQQGTSHAWSNRSDSDCLVAYVLLDAIDGISVSS